MQRTLMWLFFASSPWKLVTNYVLKLMGLNFYDYDGFQPKITHPKHFSINKLIFFFSCNWNFFSLLMNTSKNQWRSTGGKRGEEYQNVLFNFFLHPLKIPITRETDTQKKLSNLAKMVKHQTFLSFKNWNLANLLSQIFFCFSFWWEEVWEDWP